MRIRILIGILVLAGVGLGVKLLFFSGSSDSDEPDETRKRIARLAEAKDVEALAERVRGGDAHAAELAVTALGTLGKRALPVLEQALKDERPAVREKAATSFAKVAPRQQAGKIAALVKPDQPPNVRAAAVAGLDRMFAFQEMDSIIDAMADPDPAVRRRASRAATKFSGVTVQHNPDASLEECRQAALRMRQHWEQDKHNALKYLNSYYQSHYQAAGKE